MRRNRRERVAARAKKNKFLAIGEGIIITILVLFVLIVLIQRFTNNNVSFGGVRVFTVLSQSMEPVYNVGDVLIVKKVDTSKLKKGDDISYLGAEGEYKNKIITHRIMDVNIDSVTNERMFVTQGVNNGYEDPSIKENQIYGKVYFKSKILSFVSKMTKNTVVFFLFIFVPILLYIGLEIINYALGKAEPRRRY